MKKALLIILPIIVVIVVIFLFLKKNKDNDDDSGTDTKTVIGKTAFAKNPNGINIRRGQSTTATIIKKDAKGKIGKVIEVVDGADLLSTEKWYRVELSEPAIYNETTGIAGGMMHTATIGYVRSDVVTLE